MTEFKPGDMVECVDADEQFLSPGDVRVLAGQRYTISGVPQNIFGEIGVHLAEIRNPSGRAYAATRFRLIRPPATDISALTEIVRKVFAGGRVPT